MQSDLLNWLDERSLTTEDLKDWRVTYDEQNNRLVIPTYTPGNRFCFDLYRNFDSTKPRYEFQPGSRHAMILYGLNRTLTSIRHSKYVIVVEGFSDCLSLYRYGITSVCATQTSKISSTQKQILKSFSDKQIIFGDGDPAGYQFMNEAGLPSFSVPNHDPSSAIRAGVDIKKLVEQQLGKAL